MKKSTLLSVVLLLAGIFAARAQNQLAKGNVLVGADLTNMNVQLNSPNIFNLTIDPKAAWFIQNNLAVGPYINFTLATAKGAGTSITYGVGGFARLYIQKVNDKNINLSQHARFFVEGNAGVEGNNPAQGGNTNGLGLGIGPGLAYFISPNIALETLFKFNGIVGFGSTTANSTLSLAVGFQIYMPGKKAQAAMKGQQIQ
jgi:hypothetical protein